MKVSILTIGIIAFMTACSDNSTGNHEGHQQHDTSSTPIKDTAKKSLPATVSQTIGAANITINYHSPAVRGRVIWGGLIAYDNVWVTGAHSATTLETTRNFTVNNTNIPAGKYALFTIPSKSEWTVIINKNWDQHLADEYNEADDIVRIKVKPDTMPAITERLKYEIIPQQANVGNIVISWEKLRLFFPIEVK